MAGYGSRPYGGSPYGGGETSAPGGPVSYSRTAADSIAIYDAIAAHLYASDDLAISDSAQPGPVFFAAYDSIPFGDAGSSTGLSRAFVFQFGIDVAGAEFSTAKLFQLGIDVAVSNARYGQLWPIGWGSPFIFDPTLLVPYGQLWPRYTSKPPAYGQWGLEDGVYGEKLWQSGQGVGTSVTGGPTSGGGIEGGPGGTGGGSGGTGGTGGGTTGGGTGSSFVGALDSVSVFDSVTRTGSGGINSFSMSASDRVSVFDSVAFSGGIRIYHLSASDSVSVHDAATDTSLVATTRIYWGASILGSVYGGTNAGYANPPWPGTPDDATWNLFESHAGKRVAAIAVHENFVTWSSSPMDHAFSRGAFCLMTSGLEGGATMASIAAGSWDSQIDAWAQQVASWGKPFMFRWCWEMNGNWGTSSGYTWQTEYGTTAAQYVAAWQRFKSRCDAQGATNITWVWCPNIWTGSGTVSVDPTPWYPGDAYVDWLGIDGYNTGSTSESFVNLYTHSMNGFASLSPNKPIVICEFASEDSYGSSGKASWITDTFAQIANKTFPQIKAALWYNNNNGSYTDGSGATDTFAIESSSASQSAFAASIANSKFVAAPAGGWTSGKVPQP